MRDDLVGLEITDQELERLTNLPVKNELIIITKYLHIWRDLLIAKIKGSEVATVIFVGSSGGLIIYILLSVIMKIFFSWIDLPPAFLLIFLSIWLGGVIQSLLYLNWRVKSKFLKEKMTNSLGILLQDVERYNTMIKAIDINDQIEAAGNLEVAIQNRPRVIEALNITRLELVRALKTERILRENKNFILSNSELFSQNLATLTSMQVTEQATEHGRILNEALQIALDVQYEMGKLQNQR
ncbi:MAG: hypothetical protein EAZ76_09370 [Nostocales cyanobacterium]|nr:MAG: hypothetical protein EAZ87_02980 [Nostocales cyanobacterium]TAF14654.1 MAG: hypothetical protein EAZ76_09370 [Nostocales cyanobacterium]